MVRYEQVRTFFYSTESEEAKSEVLSISAICPRACYSRSLDVYIKFCKIFVSGPSNLNLYSVVEVKYCLNADVDAADKNPYQQGLVIEFFLRKPLTGDFLTQILPTTLFVLIRLDLFIKEGVLNTDLIVKL